jgi:hypothetical protein
VRVYRGPLRTVTFRLRIPRAAQGPLFVTIHGPSESSVVSPSSQSLTDALASALGSTSGAPTSSSSTSISSMLELRLAIAGIARYDGLYANIPGHARRRVYRNSSLLITGRTTLGFVVGS